MIPVVLKGLENLNIYTKESCITCLEANAPMIPVYQKWLQEGGKPGCLHLSSVRQELVNRQLSCILESTAWNTVKFVTTGNTGYYAQDCNIRNDYGTNIRMRLFI